MKRSALFLLCCLVLSCATPAAVRQLSQEQLQTQEAFGTSLKAYLDVIQRFADTQKAAAERQIDDLTREATKLYARKAEMRLEKAPNREARQDILDELAQNVRSDLATAESQKAQIAARIMQLKEKNRELQSAYAAIVEAQRKLNEYIQIQKLDEVAVNEVLGKVKINRERLNQVVADVVTITEDIRKMMERWK